MRSTQPTQIPPVRIAPDIVEESLAALIPLVLLHPDTNHPGRPHALQVLANTPHRQVLEAILDHVEQMDWESSGPWGHSRLMALLKEHLEPLAQQPQQDDISTLLRVIAGGSTGETHAFLWRPAVLAAKALLTLAEKKPTRELLPALESLRAGIANPKAPLEFLPIRLRLARVLKQLNQLPIPSEPTHD